MSRSEPRQVFPEPLELLFERSDLPRGALPAALARVYGGGLGFRHPCLFANFVASIDGVVALPEGGESGQVISQSSVADRFVMGVLRACADAVLVGAGTFRRSPRHLWRAGTIFPAAGAAFAELRHSLGLRPEPTFVLVSGSGAVDLSMPALRNAWVVTTRAGAAELRRAAPATTRIEVAGDEHVRLADVVAMLRAEGHDRLLTEGGPSLIADLVRDRLLDELFLTTSPVLYGRYGGDGRKSLADGLDLGGVPLSLLSLRRHESHLFLRYELKAS